MRSALAVVSSCAPLCLGWPPRAGQPVHRISYRDRRNRSPPCALRAPCENGCGIPCRGDDGRRVRVARLKTGSVNRLRYRSSNCPREFDPTAFPCECPGHGPILISLRMQMTLSHDQRSSRRWGSGAPHSRQRGRLACGSPTGAISRTVRRRRRDHLAVKTGPVHGHESVVTGVRRTASASSTNDAKRGSTG